MLYSTMTVQGQQTTRAFKPNQKYFK